MNKKNFKKDEKDDLIYFFMECWFNGYRINDSKVKEKLINIENYREFIFSYKPPIIIPIMVFSLIIGVVMSFIDTSLDINQIMVNSMLGIYILVCLVYFLKLKNILKNSQPITKDEKRKICEGRR